MDALTLLRTGRATERLAAGHEGGSSMHAEQRATWKTQRAASPASLDLAYRALSSVDDDCTVVLVPV